MAVANFQPIKVKKQQQCLDEAENQIKQNKKPLKNRNLNLFKII